MNPKSPDTQETCFPREIWFQIFLYLPIGFIEDERDMSDLEKGSVSSVVNVSNCVSMHTGSSSASSSTTTTPRGLRHHISSENLPRIYISLLPYHLTCRQFHDVLSSKLYWEDAFRNVFFCEGDEFVERGAFDEESVQTTPSLTGGSPHTPRDVLSSLPAHAIRHKFLTQIKSLCGDYVNCGKAHHLDMYQYYIILNEEMKMHNLEARLVEMKMKEILRDVRRDIYGEEDESSQSDTSRLSLKSTPSSPLNGREPSPHRDKSPSTKRTSTTQRVHLSWPPAFTFGIKFLRGKTFRLNEDIRSTLTGIQFGRFVAFTQRWITSQHFVTSTIGTTDEITDPQHPNKVNELRGSWHDVYQFRGTFTMLRKTIDDPPTSQDDDNPYTIHWIQQFAEDSKKRHPLVVMETSKWCTLDAYMLLPLSEQNQQRGHLSTHQAFTHVKYTLKLRNTFHKEINACYVGGSAYQILDDGSQASECVIVGNIRENYLSFLIFHGPETELKMRVLCRIVRTEGGKIQECVGLAHDDDKICGVVRLCVDPTKNVERLILGSRWENFRR